MPYLKPRKYVSVGQRKIKAQLNIVSRKLVYVGGEIRFQSEMDLEDYIEERFTDIFPDWVLVKRQYSVKMQRCDLLCCAKSDKQPVIIELKNEEDRYIVSQLIRYRQAILTEKPFADQIDYSLPVKLVAIAPTFHQDNYIDKEASKFEEYFCFWKFSVENHNNSGRFKLCSQTYDIPYPIFGLPEQPSTSDSDLARLYSFAYKFASKLDREYRDDFWGLRTLFKAQPKVKEMVNSSYTKILYGTGEGQNHKKLAEITNTPRGMCLYLWLPTAVKTKNIKIPVARYGLVLAKNSNPFSKTSIVEWLICTKDNIDLRDRAKIRMDLPLGRTGMSKWCTSDSYLSHVTGGSPNTFWLLIGILKDIKPPIDNATYEWWELYKTQNHDLLGRYIDLAVKTWTSRVK